MQFILSMLFVTIEIYSIILVAYAFLSFVPSLYSSTLGRSIIWLVNPLLSPFKKWNLVYLGLDWTPFVAMLFLRGLLYLLSHLALVFF